ncbi:MAG: type III secretion system export apparatus subunit SctR [Pseudomonadota bacterium]
MLATTLPAFAEAQTQQSLPTLSDRPIVTVLLLAALSLLPIVAVLTSSFVKIAVVLSIVRNAIGAPQVPPSMVVTGLALVLSALVMTPVAEKMYDTLKPAFMVREKESAEKAAADLVSTAASAAEPLRQFLAKHAHSRDRAVFVDIARRMRPPEERARIADSGFLVLLPAFLTSELKEAFSIGFLLFIPFLVIDLVVANVLLSLGMHMLSPTTISLPFKLLLFVMVDGWALLARGLALSYA